jgi:hypothetical protein
MFKTDVSGLFIDPIVKLSKKNTGSVCQPVNGSSIFLQNFSSHLPDYTIYMF